MRLYLSLFLCLPFMLQAQQNTLNTAANAAYMKPIEREMIYELNLLRSNPAAYVEHIEPYLEMARRDFAEHGRGPAWYSIQTTFTYENDRETVKKDTIWHYMFQEELHAVESLIHDLENTPPLSILQPHEGIYKAAQKHANDLNANGWSLSHRGSDGSWPDDRITLFAPDMSYGNENLAGRFPEPSARQIVIDLLIDSGITGYGHRYNILEPDWTHAACYMAGLQEGMYRWVQNFGSKRG
jgi:uncharacterized protein YkwD